MLIIKKGNVLEATENLICHQVNEDGVMGGGLALQIATNYPDVALEYKKYCETFKNNNFNLFGESQYCFINDNQRIVNCFTQMNFITQYNLVKKVFIKIKNTAKENRWTIAIPYKYGCGIADGSWETLESILLDIFTDYDLVIYKWEG